MDIKKQFRYVIVDPDSKDKHERKLENKSKLNDDTLSGTEGFYSSDSSSQNLQTKSVNAPQIVLSDNDIWPSPQGPQHHTPDPKEIELQDISSLPPIVNNQENEATLKY